VAGHRSQNTIRAELGKQRGAAGPNVEQRERLVRDGVVNDTLTSTGEL
jgi:hypothetical protein